MAALCVQGLRVVVSVRVTLDVPSATVRCRCAIVADVYIIRGSWRLPRIAGRNSQNGRNESRYLMAQAIKGTRVVCYTEKSPGVFHCFRNTGEPPFALLKSPKAAGGRKWSVTYRDPKAADPFGGSANMHFVNKNLALRELTWVLNTLSGYQLGLEEYVATKAVALPHG